MDTVHGATGSTDVEFPTRVSARGVASGLLVGLALEGTLLVLGAAIGLSAYQPRGDVAKGLGIGFGVWLLVTLLVSAFVGGWIATGAARAIRRRDGVLHGLVTWAAVTVVGMALVGGAVRGMVGSMIGLARNVAPQQIERAIGSATDSAQQVPKEQLAAKSDEAARGAGLGSWGLFVALALPLFAAIGGGVIAAGRERRVAGLPDERALRRRRAIVTAPTHTSELPTRPLPST